MSGADELSTAAYWNARYAAEPAGATFDWFRDFGALAPFLSKHLPGRKEGVRIVQLGCGNSTLSADLYADGYHDQLNVDFSEEVIAHMAAKHPEMQWRVMDVRDMKIEDASVDVAIDKGTLDAMMNDGSPWDPPEHVKTNTKAYIDEVARILKPGGTFLYITYRQPHFVRPRISRADVWPEPACEKLHDGSGMLEYFGWVMRKSCVHAHVIPRE